mmetsp:Transcript_56447/g.138691  ORF Transcript_56447/g.138691 Transcript_56447/m.138691 type:complete len:219 (-) Transcript_56447:616-1272(-)
MRGRIATTAGTGAAAIAYSVRTATREVAITGSRCSRGNRCSRRGSVPLGFVRIHRCRRLLRSCGPGRHTKLSVRRRQCSVLNTGCANTSGRGRARNRTRQCASRVCRIGRRCSNVRLASLAGASTHVWRVASGGGGYCDGSGCCRLGGACRAARVRGGSGGGCSGVYHRHNTRIGGDSGGRCSRCGGSVRRRVSSPHSAGGSSGNVRAAVTASNSGTG